MDTLNTAAPAGKKKKGTIRFELRTEKADKDGKAPVRLIFQVRGTAEILQYWAKDISPKLGPANSASNLHG